jgi:hypothetical protein
MKVPTMGHRFQLVEEVKAPTLATLKGVAVKGLHKCFHQWYSRKKCMTVDGNYFEGSVK